MVKRYGTMWLAAVLVVLTAFAATAQAQGYDEAERNFKRVTADPNSTTQDKAQAVRGLSVATGRDVRDALRTLFSVLKGRERWMPSDSQIRQYEEEIKKLEQEREGILQRNSFRSQAELDAAQNRVSVEIPNEINKLKDKIGTLPACQQAAIDAIGRMQAPEAKEEIIKGVADRDDAVATACLMAVKEHNWSDAYQAVVDAYNRARRNAGIRSLCVATLRVIAPTAAFDIFRQALSDESNLVRSHAIAALRGIRRAESIDALIERLDAEPAGRLKWDIVNALRDLTGKMEYGEDANQWRPWWNRNKDGFRLPPPSNPESVGTGNDNGGSPDAKKTGTFYGIEIRTKHPVFVIDRSGSMMVSIDNQHDGQQGALPPGVKSKWQLLQEELAKTIKGLPEDGTFAIVWYSTDVSAYLDGRVIAASERNKRDAEAAINAMNAEGLTNIHEALERGFEVCQGSPMEGVVITGDGDLKCDTIFFLTDGTPTAGPPIDGITPTNTVNDPNRAAYERALLNLITQWNQTRNITIHTICIGSGGNIEFLRELATRNRGTFRHVER